jgi:hypothetical protein
MAALGVSKASMKGGQLHEGRPQAVNPQFRAKGNLCQSLPEFFDLNQ